MTCQIPIVFSTASRSRRRRSLALAVKRFAASSGLGSRREKPRAEIAASSEQYPLETCWRERCTLVA
jgi:hypothetical protein